ncbi:MAG TPA: hypothetical protein VN893_00710 [Bryobacteraceae bacterium]|nr:hypothetical protein [Bryobacteraceae bacterium]
MKFRVLVVAAVCLAIAAGLTQYRTWSLSQDALLRRLPSDGAVIVSIDFGELRRAGVLKIFGGSKVTEEPEYRTFVRQTGFDYLNDLDSALISFHASGTYFLLRGRFNWKALEEYATHQGGDCRDSFCRVAGSVAARRISFFALRKNIMALAVGADASAAVRLRTAGRRLAEIPGDPVWSLIPIAALKQNGSMPAGAAVLAQALDGARSVVLAATPEGTRVAVRLDATCGSAAQASALATRLRDITAHLRDAVATPDPKDLGGVLAAGVFEQKEVHVLGRWPVEREFLESLAGGAL